MRKPCCDQIDTKKGAWSKQEDQRLIDYITKHGEGSWRILPKAAGLLRCGKSCRLRWINYLRPDLKKGNFEEDEEDLIIKLHALLGNRWSLIAGRLPGRTDNEVKNYWNTHLKRRLINMGIDPNNHNLKQVIAHSKNFSSGPSETSIESKNLISKMLKKKSCINDHVSNDGVPGLNLNLTLTIPSMVGNVDDVKKGNESTILMEINESDSPPTLFLFT